MAVTDWSGASIQINSYDEYGAPAPGNAGRFGYTGQVWLPETGLYHYKNRAYNPELGRFMQTDPIGVNGGMNLYAYVGGDPVNLVDPLGLAWVKRRMCTSYVELTDGGKGGSCSIGYVWQEDYYGLGGKEGSGGLPPGGVGGGGSGDPQCPADLSEPLGEGPVGRPLTVGAPPTFTRWSSMEAGVASFADRARGNLQSPETAGLEIGGAIFWTPQGYRFGETLVGTRHSMTEAFERAQQSWTPVEARNLAGVWHVHPGGTQLSSLFSRGDIATGLQGPSSQDDLAMFLINREGQWVINRHTGAGSSYCDQTGTAGTPF